ncbi:MULTISPECIES: HNH endonuclease [Clostridium]|uniref:HNH endonuclease n=2 Tax=Clostridium TaxID=1485 RepID=A0A151AQD7_9CLOT|nr:MULTISPECIES: HNH endonuclease signature motif containing protein [Clostridium]MBE6079003.1 HNH endonuclease [Clostridium lundense]KYH29848.1 hypothetical protein CLCOL_04860 [Clostridium colicanis DSM 13634]MBE6042696.1 HNH endonuclease [Clostridium thermopalmarium]PRR75229.1 hypothetical protein CPAL_07810 [Clostridium thermopalmarium DSM 5974]PVZ27985.1 hypothetical protein LX19_00524 [Clostridium thermopalmarium DSM 5974]
MSQCVICGEQGEKHHIVYKSQGGLDIPMNYIFLCPYHHRGLDGPHKNRKIDLKYKRMLQNNIMNVLKNDFYTLEEISKVLEINPFQTKILSNEIKRYKLGYKRIDIIKRIMGGKLY